MISFYSLLAIAVCKISFSGTAVSARFINVCSRLKTFTTFTKNFATDCLFSFGAPVLEGPHLGASAMFHVSSGCVQLVNCWLCRKFSGIPSSLPQQL